MICLVNPRSTRWRYRIPLSILSIGASIEGLYDYEIVDGNLDPDIFTSLPGLVRGKGIRYVGFTVMPGPQLEQAIPLAGHHLGRVFSLSSHRGGPRRAVR
jgi:hypothetical protein